MGVYSLFLVILGGFPRIVTRGRLTHLPPSLGFGQGKSTTFYFTESFRCFRLNETVLETTQTKQADSQLFFAPKNFKIPLVVLENELFEIAWLISKTSQKLKHIHHAYMVVCIR